MEKRRCDQCEYYKEVARFERPRCRLKLPVATSGGKFFLPKIDDDGYCRDWEPKWSDNPIIAEAWLEFKLVHKLITSGEKDG